MYESVHSKINKEAGPVMKAAYETCCIHKHSYTKETCPRCRPAVSLYYSKRNYHCILQSHHSQMAKSSEVQVLFRIYFGVCTNPISCINRSYTETSLCRLFPEVLYANVQIWHPYGRYELVTTSFIGDIPVYDSYNRNSTLPLHLDLWLREPIFQGSELCNEWRSTSPTSFPLTRHITTRHLAFVTNAGPWPPKPTRYLFTHTYNPYTAKYPTRPQVVT